MKSTWHSLKPWLTVMERQSRRTKMISRSLSWRKTMITAMNARRNCCLNCIQRWQSRYSKMKIMRSSRNRIQISWLRYMTGWFCWVSSKRRVKNVRTRGRSITTLSRWYYCCLIYASRGTSRLLHLCRPSIHLISVWPSWEEMTYTTSQWEMPLSVS